MTSSTTKPNHPAVILKRTTALAFFLLLTGCMMAGPDYRPVEPAAPAAWNTEPAEGVIVGDAEMTTVHWWRSLNDPQLSQLMERALQGNLDLATATLRIAEARARYGISRADLFPTLDTGATVSREQSSENVETGAVYNYYRVGFDAAWELDLFGGVRRSVEAAKADIDLQQETFHAALVSLQAEVALNYLDLRTAQARLAALESNLAAQEETYQLNQSRYEAGLIDELAVQQASYNMEQTRSQIPPLQSAIEIAKNRLSILLGLAPGSLHQDLAALTPIPTLPPSVAIGIPAETLRQRPDVRQAERELARQTALVGVATAELYPKLRLSGTLGLESLSENSLFESASRAWGIGSVISWNIFDAGRIRNNIEVQSLLQEQALLNYRNVVLLAHEEVENALVAFAKEQLRRDALSRATDAARRANAIAQDKYEAGLVDFSNVLDAQRSLSSFEDQLAQSSGAVTANLVLLYKALGGDWTSYYSMEQ